jgi:hypothetical protein
LAVMTWVLPLIRVTVVLLAPVSRTAVPLGLSGNPSRFKIPRGMPATLRQPPAPLREITPITTLTGLDCGLGCTMGDKVAMAAVPMTTMTRPRAKR